MTIPHPFPYQGSKRKIAPTILHHFADSVDRLFEPFCGSGAVSIAAAYFAKAQRFVLNDINGPLMTLWQHIIEEPKYLAAQYRDLWHAQLGQERVFYDLVRDQFNQTHRPDTLLYLLARCVKASVRYNANGEFNQSPDNRRKGMRPDMVKHHILATSALLKGRATLSSVDYRAVIHAATPDDLIYFDPPYQGVCNNDDPRYLEGVRFDEFVHTLAQLNARGIRYIVSYDGRTGTKRHGRQLPASLHLKHLEVDAGRSTQATLLGQTSRTYEALYLSPALVAQLHVLPNAQLELDLR